MTKFPGFPFERSTQLAPFLIRRCDEHHEVFKTFGTIRARVCDIGRMSYLVLIVLPRGNIHFRVYYCLLVLVLSSCSPSDYKVPRPKYTHNDFSYIIQFSTKDSSLLAYSLVTKTCSQGPRAVVEFLTVGFRLAQQ